MEVIEQINNTRKYLDRVERHVLNIQKAWKVIEDTCKDMRFIWDDFYFFSIRDAIREHDLSKLSEQEFVQYRKVFFPTASEPEYNLTEAWEHHKKHNPHHWENWTTNPMTSPNEWEIHCVHMVCDWMAMSYEIGDTAQQYYEANQHKIILPDYAIEFIYNIFERINEKEQQKEIS